MADDFSQALNSFREAQQKERAKEARELEKTQAYETKKLEEINKKLQNANDVQRRALESDKAQIEATRTERKERTEHRSAVRQALDEEKGALEEFKKSLEEQGKKATDSKEYNKKSLELQKRELALRLRETDSPSARKEIRDEQKALTKKHGNLLQKMAVGITGMWGSMKDKMKGKIKSLWSIIKGTLFAAFLIGLIAFMESEYWEKAKEKIVDFAVWLKDKLWPGLKEWVLKLKEINLEGLTNSIKTIGLMFAGLIAALAIGKLFGIALPLGAMGLLIGGGAIIAAVALWIHKDEIMNGLTNISNMFERFGIDLNEMEIAALGIITALGLLTLAKKGITRAIMGGLAALGIGTLLAPKDVPKTKTKYKHGQVLKHGTGRVVFDANMKGGGGFKEYTGDVKAGKIVQTGEGGKFPKMHGSDKTGVGKLVKGGLSAVEEGVPKGILGRIKSVTGLARSVPFIGHAISAGLGGLAISSYLNAEGDKEKAVEHLSGNMGQFIGAFALPAILAAMGFIAGFNPISLIAGVLAGTFGAIAGKSIHQGLAQFMYDMPITAFGDKLNKKINNLINGTDVGGVEDFREQAAILAETRSAPARLQTDLSLEGTGLEGRNGSTPFNLTSTGSGPEKFAPPIRQYFPQIAKPQLPMLDLPKAQGLRPYSRDVPLPPGLKLIIAPNEDQRSSLIQLQQIERNTAAIATSNPGATFVTSTASSNSGNIHTEHHHAMLIGDNNGNRAAVNVREVWA
tara:strand:+ start:92 stop:2317 length:2226 start_codon:yes stop_codon:yes gene_type:complete